jgi:hypothetical protein
MKKNTLCILITLLSLNFYAQELIFESVQHVGANPDLSGIDGRDELVLDFQVDNTGNTYTLFNMGKDPNPFIEKRRVDGTMIWRDNIKGLTKLVLNSDQTKIYAIGTFSGTIDVDPSSKTKNITSQGGLDTYLLELNANDGKYIAVKQYSSLGDVDAEAMISDDNGFIYISGTFSQTANFDPDNEAPNNSGTLTSVNVDFFILKLDQSGNFTNIFQLKNDSNANIRLKTLTTDKSNNIYLGAQFIGSIDVNPDPNTDTILTTGNKPNYLLLKLDSEGNFSHVKQIKNNTSIALNGVHLAVDSNENTYGIVNFVGGEIELDSDHKFSTGNVSSVLFKQDNEGNLLWAYQYTSGQPSLSGIVVNSQKSRLYITGYFTGVADFNLAPGDDQVFELTSAPSQPDGFIQTLNLDGHFIEASRFGGSGFDVGSLISLDASNNVMVAGIFSDTVDFNPSTEETEALTAKGDKDAFLLKLKSVVPTDYETFIIDDIEYSIISRNPNKVEITKGTTATGNVDIPDKIVHEQVEYTVTSIGINAFKDNPLTTVTIPNTVTVIKQEAFRNCGLTSITIPGSVTSVMNSAFRDNKIKSIEIPSSLRVIADGTFQDNSLDRIAIPNTVTSIGSYAFSGNQLASITIPGSVVSIGAYAFAFNKIENAEIPEGITSLEKGVFQNNQLASITIPNGVINIWDSAFEENNLTSVTIPEGVVTIGARAFMGNNLNEVIAKGYSPASIFDLSTNTPSFGNTENTHLIIPIGTTDAYINKHWTGFKSITEVVVPVDYLETFMIDDIEYGITSRNPNKVEIAYGTTATADANIPNKIVHEQIEYTVTSIGANAFFDNGLTSITIPASVGIIKSGAFGNNPLLTHVITKGSDPATIIGNSFGDRGGLHVTIPIGSKSAYSDKGWTGFGSVVSIGDSFTGGNMVYVITSTYPETVEVKNLSVNAESVIVPDTVSFEGFNYDVTSIGEGAFRDKNLASAIVGNKVVSIGNNAFRDNQGLVSIVLGNSVVSLGDNAFRDASLTDIDIPVGVISIGSYTFAYNKLTTVNIPNTVTSIGDRAFRKNKLTRVELSANVAFIEDYAFSGNEGLVRVVAKGTTPAEIKENSFESRGNIDLTIPFDTKSLYEDAGWTGFKSITEAAETTGIQLSLNIYLQGACLNANTNGDILMRDDLRQSNLIPITSPYEDAKEMGSGILDIEGNNAMVDWVFVELRNEANTELILGLSAILQRDGNVVLNAEDLAPIKAGSYNLAVYHRNHLGIITANAITMGQGATTTVDFTTDVTLVAGGINAVVEIDEGVFAMVSGDFDSNGQVQNPDLNAIISSLGIFGYSNADMDMNGQVQNTDINSITNQNLGRGKQFSNLLTQIRFLYKKI